MSKQVFPRTSLALLAFVLLGEASSALAAATIVIQNSDPAGVGFNDPTSAAPVGGNAGTTVGEQRLIAFQAAANVWGATLDSTPTITVQATWEALSCTSTSAVLGSAGSIAVWSDFAGAPYAGTWYGDALANKLFGSDLGGDTAEMRARFNVNLGNTGCLDGTHWYYGLDANHGADIDLVTVLVHEFSHGLGFQTFTSGSSGAQLGGQPSIYDRFLVDAATGKSWLQMTNAERATSTLNSRALVWDGPQVTSDVPSVLAAGTPLLKVNSPAAIAGNYDVGTAAFGPILSSPGVTGNVVQALDPADGSGPSTTDGCSALTNAGAVSGNIALVDRGTCAFIVKAKNAQNAGAIGVIIADNVTGSPPGGMGGSDPTINIPIVRITLSDGNTVKTQLASGVNATLGVNLAVRSGADPLGRALLFSPNPFQGGSSVSHWDTIAFPNQLMEPSISADLTHNVTPPSDLTFSLLSDVGWVLSSLPSTIATIAGDNQGAMVGQQFGVALRATVKDASNIGVFGVPVTFTAPALLASGTFASTGTRTATATTDDSGVATAPALTANGQAGYYSVNATAPGAGTTVFALKNMLSPTAAPATISGNVQTPDGLPLAGVALRLAGPSLLTTITDSNGKYHFDNVDTDKFYTITPALANYGFSPASRSFSLIGSKTDAVFTAMPDVIVTANAIDTPEYFVRQQYLDFLGREPDQGGFDYWTARLNECSADADCIRGRRIDVAAAFFVAPEFQQTGSFIYRLYKGALGRQLSYAEFSADRQQVVGGPSLDSSKTTFADAFVARPEFTQKYEANLTAESFVDALLQTLRDSASVDLSSERGYLIGKYNSGNTTNESRSLVVRDVTDGPALSLAVYNQAFVLMEYFGYLRRDPDQGGFDFWLNVLDNREPGNFRGMVCSFLSSTEYQHRFSSMATRNNTECQR